MRVTVDAGGRKIEIECDDRNVSPDAIADKALSVWQATANGGNASAPGYGYQAERAGRQQSPMSMGGYGGSYIHDPKATTQGNA